MGRCLATILLAVIVPLFVENSICFNIEQEKLFNTIIDQFTEEKETKNGENTRSQTWEIDNTTMIETNKTYGNGDNFRIIRFIQWKDGTKSNQTNDTMLDSEENKHQKFSMFNIYSTGEKSTQEIYTIVLTNGTLLQKDSVSDDKAKVTSKSVKYPFVTTQ